MPYVFYVKWTDLGEDIINNVEFFYAEKSAKHFRNQLLEKRNENGGPEYSDIYISDVCYFQYRNINDLLSYLNEIQQVKT